MSEIPTLDQRLATTVDAVQANRLDEVSAEDLTLLSENIYKFSATERSALQEKIKEIAIVRSQIEEAKRTAIDASFLALEARLNAVESSEARFAAPSVLVPGVTPEYTPVIGQKIGGAVETGVVTAVDHAASGAAFTWEAYRSVFAKNKVGASVAMATGAAAVAYIGYKVFGWVKGQGDSPSWWGRFWRGTGAVALATAGLGGVGWIARKYGVDPRMLEKPKTVSEKKIETKKNKPAKAEPLPKEEGAGTESDTERKKVEELKGQTINFLDGKEHDFVLDGIKYKVGITESGGITVNGKKWQIKGVGLNALATMRIDNAAFSSDQLKLVITGKVPLPFASSETQSASMNMPQIVELIKYLDSDNIKAYSVGEPDENGAYPAELVRQ